MIALTAALLFAFAHAAPVSTASAQTQTQSSGSSSSAQDSTAEKAMQQEHPSETKAAEPSAIAAPVQQNIRFIEKEFLAVADAMPEAKYSFAPTSGEFKGVRTFGQQVAHVAAANFAFADSVTGSKTPAKKPTTKADIMAYIKDSFDALDKAAGTLTTANAVDAVPGPFGMGANAPYGPSNRLGLLVIAAAHCRDHYGQMVVYERMNGIIPPPSRKQ